MNDYGLSAEERFLAHRDQPTSAGCREWSGSRTKDGYGTMGDGSGGTVYVHRYAWQRVNGPIPPGLQVLHHCDNPPCTEEDHLFAGTNMDNIVDRMTKGRRAGALGERVRTAKISRADADAMRRLRSEGMTFTAIAALYPVGERQVGRICAGDSWNW